MEFWLPYGTTEVPVAVPDENLLGFLSPVEDSASQNPEEAIAAALQYPISGQNLLKGVGQDKKTVVAFNADSPASTLIADLLAAELLRATPNSVQLLPSAPDITQPKPTRNPAEKKPEASCLLSRHDLRTSAAAKVGQLESGREVLINEAFANTDIRCVVTNVTVNAFWGYSGGPSFVIPCLASENTVKACLGPILRSARQPGVLSGNLMHEALLRASQAVRIDLAIHLVERPDGKVAGVFTGDFLGTFDQACNLAGKVFRPALERRADIVISSAGGAPWDRTLFDASSAAIIAASVCKDNGIVVLVAECPDGTGRLTSTGPIPRDSATRTLQTRRVSTLERLIEYSVHRVSSDHRTYLVSTLPEHQASLHNFLSARSVGSALQRATRHAGKDATVAVISHGCLTAPLIG